MVAVAAVLSVVLAGWLVLVQPWRGRQRYRRLLERLRHDPSARLEHYRRGIAFEWVGAALVGVLAVLAHSRVRSLWPPGTDTAVAKQVPGLAHLYQGPTGVALTGLAGAYLAWIALATGSLVPVMVLHALLDLRILGLPLDAVPFPGPDA